MEGDAVPNQLNPTDARKRRTKSLGSICRDTPNKPPTESPEPPDEAVWDGRPVLGASASGGGGRLRRAVVLAAGPAVGRYLALLSPCRK